MGEEPSKLINEEFKRIFETFVYPFETSDQLISKMSESKRMKYYKEAVKLRDSDVTKQERNEICRSLYYELAVNGDNEVIRAFYKGALLFASKYRSRIDVLASKDAKEENDALERAQEKINELIG